MFRRNQPTPTPSAPAKPEAIAIDLTELATLERVLLEADRLRRYFYEGHPYYGMDLITVHDVIGLLYQRAGAASVVQPDQQRARIPLYRHEFKWLTDAITTMDAHPTSARRVPEARALHNRFNALLGQARAITHMGGTAVFDPDAPAPVVPALPAREH
ncbi:hypothetical protein ACFZAV_42810 [Streptomyces sp. NPDC008343]|uniref:hypothetical protein n=1 Tax=Streptomyces sp. NPDC008343 TaxID=3364828 RepID=UPI0036E01537